MKISIVINCYNYRAFVGQAIESALAQTHADTEVVVVDDGSTDGSSDLICGYGSRIVAVLKDNGGQGSAYNAGFAAASGALVIFLDADDWLYPQAAQQLAAAWQPGDSKLQFQLHIVNAEGQPQGRVLPREMNDDQALALLSRFGTYGTPPGSGNAYSADFLRQVLPMDAAPWRSAADSVTLLLAPAHGAVRSLRRPLGAYRVHKASAPGSLLFNNAPKGVWCEFDRVERSRRLVSQHLRKLGLPCREPLLFAPWEARLLALCLAFGGPRSDGVLVQRGPLMRLALASVWLWPSLSLAMRVAQSSWMLSLWLLPAALSRRIGGIDRALKGAASAR